MRVARGVDIPLEEIELRASRSSGPGGQHANVTASRIEAVFDVNAVAFGFVETRLTAAKEDSETIQREGKNIKLGIPEQMRAMASMLIPLGRPATPEEAAGGVFFLCSPWSNYVHGQTLNVTGGQFTGMTT